MSSVSHIYVFDNFELDEQAGTVLSNGEMVELTNTEYSLLQYLVKHPRKIHSYSDLYEEAVGLGGRSTQNTIPAHVSNLKRKLKNYSDNDFIVNIPKSGYRLDTQVSQKPRVDEIPIISGQIEPIRNKIECPTENEPLEDNKNLDDFINSSETDEPSKDDSNYKTFGRKEMTVAFSGIIISILFLASTFSSLNYSNVSFSKVLFIGIAGICYGVLQVIGLILECAYEFNRYRRNVLKMTPAVFLLNSGAVISGFILTDKLLQNGYLSAFWVGLIFLIIGAVFSCVAGYFVLPNAPIAKARVQTQPAFAAFCKNVFLYFLPLCFIFGLLIFCFIYGRSPLTKNVVFPVIFGILWLVIFGGSLYSTFYFTDKLLVEKDGKKYKYYGLYFSLLIARAVFFFIPTAAAVIWYLIFSINYSFDKN